MECSLFALVAFMAFVVPTRGVSNELDYGNWNYREGAESVDVSNVRSVTRVLDSWGKKIFNEIKTLLHSQPSTLLPDYSRVRPLSESLNDLFREVLHLQRRINDLNHRLATVEPVLRRYGYRPPSEEQEEEEEEDTAMASNDSMAGERNWAGQVASETPASMNPMKTPTKKDAEKDKREDEQNKIGGRRAEEVGQRDGQTEMALPYWQGRDGAGHQMGAGEGGGVKEPMSRAPVRRYTVRKVVRPIRRRVVRTRRVRVYKDPNGKLRVLESDDRER